MIKAVPYFGVQFCVCYEALKLPTVLGYSHIPHGIFIVTYSGV